jgi:two-component system phosphate regulon sensor histidine kinase PhoR
MFKVREEYRREFLGNVSHELKTSLQFRAIDYWRTKVIRKKYLKHAEKRRRAINLYRRGFRYDNQT